MDAVAISPLPSGRRAALSATMRDTVRGWLAMADPAEAVPGIGAIGRSAVAEAAELSGRLGTGGDDAGAAALLGTIEGLAARTAGEAPKRRWPFGRTEAPVDLEAELPPVVRGLERARDDLMRNGIRLAGMRDRLAAVDARLEEAVHLLRLLSTGADAAAREIGAGDPRTTALRGPVAERLLERERDVLTQLAVLRQGRLSLGIVAEGQAALAAALDRARLTVVAALRTAAAAGRAVALREAAGTVGAALDSLAARH